MSDQRKILGVRWISGKDTIGVVKVAEIYDGVCYYIGVADGHDEQTDIESISLWGARLSAAVGEMLIRGE